MPVSPEAEKALPRFVDAVAAQPDLHDRLNQIADIDGLKDFLGSVEPALTGCALIPLEQATRPPKIQVDAGTFGDQTPWRLLRCTGGPLVLQLVCNQANFAIWIESC